MRRLTARNTCRRIALTGVVGLATMVGISRAAEVAPGWQWFEGSWQVTYRDSVLGAVDGMAVIGGEKPVAGNGPRRVRLFTIHPRTKAVLQTDGTAELKDSRLIIVVDNHGPVSGAAATAEAGVAQPLQIPVGVPLQVSLDGGEVSAEVVAADPPGALTIMFPVPPGNDAVSGLEGNWSYRVKDRALMARGRAGGFDPATGTVSGGETWARLHPALFTVVAHRQIHPATLAAARVHEQATGLAPGSLVWDPSVTPLPDLRARFGADVFGSVWLTIVGMELPVEPRRVRRVASDAAGLVVTGRTRANPLNPTQLDCEVALRRGFDCRPKTIRLNDVPVDWYPDAPPPPVAGMRFVRKANPFEPITALYDGDVFCVEVAFAVAPFADRQFVFSRLADGRIVEVTLVRSDDSPRLFRSQRLVYQSGEGGGAPVVDPAAVAEVGNAGIDALPPLVLSSLAGKSIDFGVFGLAAPPDPPVVIYRQVGASPSDAEKLSGPEFQTHATIACSQRVPQTPWEDALQTVRDARRRGPAPTEFEDYLLFNIVTRAAKIAGNPISLVAKEKGPDDPVKATIPVSVEQHAAAILLRRELVASLENYIDRLQAPVPVDTTAAPDEVRRQTRAWLQAQRVEAEALIKLASDGGRHPLFHMRVSGRDGTPDWGPLGGALYLWKYQRHSLKFQGKWDAFVDYAVRAIAEAKGALLQRMAMTLEQAKAPLDSDLRELLRVVGVGLDEVVNRVIPELVRPSRPDEPAYPHWVPDAEARAHVRSLYVLADAVSSQEEYSALSRDMALLVLTAPMAGTACASGLVFEAAMEARAITTALTAYRAMQVTGAVGFGFEAADVFGRILETENWARAYREREFSLGLAGLDGGERYERAVAEEFERRMGLWTGMGMRLAAPLAFGAARSWGGEAVADTLHVNLETPYQGLERIVCDRVAQRGIDSLPADGRRFFNGMVALAQRRATEIGLSRLTPVQQEALRLAGLLDGSIETGLARESSPLRMAQEEAAALVSLDPGGRLEAMAYDGPRGGDTLPLPPEAPRRFSVGERERVTAYMRDELGFPDELMDQRITFWEEAGLDADVVIAGHHYLHNRSPRALPMDEALFREKLGAFLTRTDRMSPARRQEIIDAYLAGDLEGLPPRMAGIPDEIATLLDEKAGSAVPPAPQPDGNPASPDEGLGALPPTVVGHPGPGIRRDHLEAAQRVADAINTPVVLLGSRQSGVRFSTGEPFSPDTDMELGAVGDRDALTRVLRVIDPDRKGQPGHIEVPDVIHGPMYLAKTEADALALGFLVVRPRPDAIPAEPPMLGHLPPLPPAPPALPKLGVETKGNDILGSPLPVKPSLWARPPRPGEMITLPDGTALRLGDRAINRRGTMADLRELFGSDGRPSQALLAKIFGLRPSAQDPAMPSLTLRGARNVVRNSVTSYRTILDFNAGKSVDDQIEVAHIVMHDAEGNLPYFVTERMGSTRRPPGVTREFVGTDDEFVLLHSSDGTVILRHGVPALRDEAGDAVITLWKKMIGGEILAEDLHPNNLGFRVRETAGGNERWSSVIADHERIATYDDVVNNRPHALEIGVRMTDLNQAPEELGVFSLAPDTMPDDPRVFMLKMLEFKRYIFFNRKTGTFESAYLDIDRVLDAFPDLYQHVTWPAGRTGALQQSWPGPPVLAPPPGATGPDETIPLRKAA